MNEIPTSIMARAAAALRTEGLPPHHREKLADDIDAVRNKVDALDEAVEGHLSRLIVEQLDATQRKLHAAHCEFRGRPVPDASYPNAEQCGDRQ
jgi:hypothetical protein